MKKSQAISESKNKPSGAPIKKENSLLNLGFNIFLPILILNKGDDWFGAWLTPFFEDTAVAILVIAILFPIAYFIYDFITRKKYNFISILGLVSVLLTGGIGILEIPTKWFAVKEASIPAIIGIAVMVSLKTRYPLVRTLLLNPELMEIEKIDASLREQNKVESFNKLLRQCTYWLGFSFLFSAVLNFILASWIVVSPSGTEAFNTEVSKMMLWSWPIIAIPSLLISMYALWILMKGIRALTGFNLEEIIKGSEKA